MDPVVEASDVARRYGDTVAIDGVSLAVDEGEVVGLIGPNGAGKTTLVRAVLGLTPVDGTVALFGAPPAAVDRARLGVLPQDFDPPRRLTPRELVRYYGGLYDEPRPPADVLSAVGIDPTDADRPYEDLSGGQQRRTCVATALVNDPDLLVLDEPTTGIDPAGRRALWRVVERLADGGATVLLTTHYMAEARTLADRVAILADGRVVAKDTPDALVRRHGGESLLRIEGVAPAAAPADPAEGTELGEATGPGPEPAAASRDLIGPVLSELDFEGDLVDGALLLRDVPPRAIGTVVAALEQAGLAYEALAWTEPDLEDVYLALTGSAQAGETGSGADMRHADGATRTTDHAERQGEDDATRTTDHAERQGEDGATRTTDHAERQGAEGATRTADHPERQGDDAPDDSGGSDRR